jgi:hypothetical protein
VRAGVQIFSALALLPFVIFFAAGFFSDRFDPHAWVETAKGRAIASSTRPCARAVGVANCVFFRLVRSRPA